MIKEITRKRLFLALTIIIGLIAVYPQTVYQPYLLQGDHGRDLYIFQQTAQGSLPYINYETANGPLMPFYYAGFIKLFGNTIQSVLIGYALLIFLAGVLIFCITTVCAKSHYAFLTALWYWGWRGEEFFYTFNHIGALAAALAVILFTLTNLENFKKRHFIAAFLCAILCLLIRLNIGLAALAGFLLTSAFYHRKDRLNPNLIVLISLLSILLGLTVIFSYQTGIYHSYFKSIQWHLIVPNILNFIIGRFNFLTQNIFMISISALIILLFLNGTTFILADRKSPTNKKLLNFLSVLLMFFFLFLMEFLAGSYFFRWVWAFPILLIIIFLVISRGSQTLSTIIRKSTYSVLLLVAILMICINYHDLVIARKTGTKFEVGNNILYMSPSQKPWIQTVEHASAQIIKLTQTDDKILTLPYDNLYCFLTNRKSAIRKTSILYGDLNEALIQIHQTDIPLIIVSNRAFRPKEESTFGIFGKDYGIDILNYIQKNYVLIDQIGPWGKTATAIQNHAVQIYLHKSRFQEKPHNSKNPNL